MHPIYNAIEREQKRLQRQLDKLTQKLDEDTFAAVSTAEKKALNSTMSLCTVPYQLSQTTQVNRAALKAAQQQADADKLELKKAENARDLQIDSYLQWSEQKAQLIYQIEQLEEARKWFSMRTAFPI